MINGAGPLTQAPSTDSMLDPLIKHDLHSDTDSQYWTLGNQSCIYESTTSHSVDPLHTRREGSHPRDDQPIGIKTNVKVRT
jgi:hypothetical protein